MASSSLASAAAAPAAPHFEKRTVAAPELPAIRAWVSKMNQDPRSREEALEDLREVKAYFANPIRQGRQTKHSDWDVSAYVLRPILHSENARTPGLNAVDCHNEKEMGKALNEFSEELSEAGGNRQEGHVRIYLGTRKNSHRVAMDAFRHRDGGFTLVTVDSITNYLYSLYETHLLSKNNPGLIKGALILTTPNMVHVEGCRIFAIHHLNALHEYQPHIQALHRKVYDNAGRTEPAPLFPGPEWAHYDGNIHYLTDGSPEIFGLLPGKFFKHMQVPKPLPGGTRTLLDEAEAWNPALKDEPVNKKGQTLRQRYESQHPGTPQEKFSRSDRTLSLDKKRIALLDRAIEYYMGLPARPPSIP